jgi:hypothetical protein
MAIEATQVTEKKSAFDKAVMHAEDMKDDPSKHKWKVFLAGPSGSGKTQATVTLPGKKLLIDFDNRAQTVAGTPKVDIYSCFEEDARAPKAWAKAEEMRKVIVSEVRQGIFPYDTIIFDGLTSMGRSALNWALTLDPGRGLGGSAARQHFGPQMDSLSKFILGTLALPLHICYTGHIELIEEEETGAHKFYPKITGKLRSEVSNWFNETYYCYRLRDDKEKRLRYFWQTGGSGRQEFFKSSLNNLGRYWTDPIELDFEVPGPKGFELLAQRRFEGKEVKS